MDEVSDEMLPTIGTLGAKRQRSSDAAIRQAARVAVQTGLAGADAYDHLPLAKQPHLHLRGIDELLSLCKDLSFNSERSGAPLAPSTISRRTS